MTFKTINFSASARASLSTSLKQYEFVYGGIDDVGVHASLGEVCIRRVAHDFSIDLADLEQLASGRENGLIIKNAMDCGAIPPTPTDDRVPDTKGWYDLIVTMLGFLSISGTRPGSFLHEKEGRLCHMVAPAKVDEEALKRTTKPLNYHTEIVNGVLPGEPGPSKGKPISPDVIALGCLRNPHDVGTTLLPVDTILQHLPYSVIVQLQAPEYEASSQSSFDVMTTVTHVPVLVRMTDQRMAMRYSRSKLSGLTPRAKAALAVLTDFLDRDELGETISLQPGDMLLMNNRTCLHRRVAIKNTARFDGSDRWLIRIYGFGHDIWQQTKRSPDQRHVIILEQPEA